LTDPAHAVAAVRAARPDRIYHLAAQSSIRAAWRDPRATIEHNVATTTNLLDAVVAEAPGARVLVAGSAEQYGPSARLPIGEDEPFRPQNPYAVSKCASELVAGFYADARGLDVVRARAFNHVGPGAEGRSVMSHFARQIAAAEVEGRGSVVVHHADVRSTRDFTDVRDVARAYRLLLEHARPGAYNVCSGSAVSVDEILTELTRRAHIPVERFRDPELLRDNEVLEIRGSHDRLTEATGWQPAVPLARSLDDTLAYWRQSLGSAVTP
ncbi:MAG: GDP-4-dehydro-6-deoxy-D-mannose reductase, partial [Thermoleophilaceae bacterium]|nr:GDP-4-dehydro-6-deoxy-D-mannose reductase [Thermoleophilaceae bacterium]